MNDKIRHNGVIENVEDTCVKVRILQTSACASCKIAGHCSASESKKKIIEIMGQGFTGRYSTGDNVVVAVSAGMGIRAVGYAFAVPFIILVSVVLIVNLLLDVGEVISALSGICSLIPYYIMLYVFRDRFGKEFSFTLES